MEALRKEIPSLPKKFSSGSAVPTESSASTRRFCWACSQAHPPGPLRPGHVSRLRMENLFSASVQACPPGHCPCYGADRRPCRRCSGASCILGARLAGIDPMGTVPHAAVLLVGDTVALAKHYDAVMPSVTRESSCGHLQGRSGGNPQGCRSLGRQALRCQAGHARRTGRGVAGPCPEIRYRLDLAGYGHVRIIASGGLYPDRIRELSAAGADAFGVGSYISHANPIDMTMDIKEIDGLPVAKRGRLPGRIENPRLIRVK